jgi:Cation transporter/ATPase, N-terminus
VKEAWLLAEAKRLLEVHGRNELPEKKTPSWMVFLLQMKAPMPIMIWCAPALSASGAQRCTRPMLSATRQCSVRTAPRIATAAGLHTTPHNAAPAVTSTPLACTLRRQQHNL